MPWTRSSVAPVGVAAHLALLVQASSARSQSTPTVGCVDVAETRLDLSGGNQDTTSTYVAPNGVRVTASAPTFVNGSFYYLGYLFNGSLDGAATSYWLSNSVGDQTLTVTLPHATPLARVRVHPTLLSDRRSSFRVEARLADSWVDVSNGVVSVAVGGPTFFDLDTSHLDAVRGQNDRPAQ